MPQEELTDRSQTERFAERLPQGQAEFWDAVRTVTRLKRQAKAATRQAEPESWSPLVALQTNGHKQPIFLVPGGHPEEDVAFFWGARVAPYLGPARPFYGLITPSYERKPTPYPHIEAMAADYVRAVRACQLSGPYFLIGECYRGIVAFEMAQQLMAQGQEVALLVLVDVRRPTQTRYRRYLAQKNLFPRIISYLRRIVDHLSKIPQIGAEERLSYLVGRARIAIAKVIPGFILSSDQRQKRHNQSLREQYAKIQQAYSPSPYPGRIFLLVSEGRYQEDPTQGWSELAAGGLEILRIPGTNATYLKEHSQALAEQLRACLDAAQGK